jgi:hypothetical protein
MRTLSPAPPCRLAPGVYLARQDDITRLLDLDSGRFSGLDAIASRLLTLALERGPAEAAAEVAGDYGAEPARVRGDLEALLADLQRRGLLERGGWGRPPGRRRLPRWLAGPCPVRGSVTTRLAGRLLRRAWWSLRLDGWAGSVERWRRPAGPPRVLPHAGAGAVIAEVDAAVRDAAAGQLLPPVACKERALVGYHLLRAVWGLPAALVVGVRHYPFAAHAWVEVGGRVVTDDAGHCAGFVPVARFE